MKQSLLPLLLLLASAAASGCGGETALEVSLVADPNVNSEGTLLSLLGTVRLVLDSSEGLYGPEPRTVGDLEIADIDGDGAGELVMRVSLSDLDHLPLIRIEAGDLPDVTLDIRLDGLALASPSTAIAAGSVKGIRFARGESSPLSVPFNLKPLYQPPRVTRVDPEDGAEGLSPKEVGLVYLEFPKRMDEASLEAAGTITLERVESGSRVDPSAVVVAYPGGTGSDSPTTVQLRLAKGLEGGSYLVTVSTSALDESGAALDQAPLLEGNQPFTSRFSITESSSGVCYPDCSVFFCQGGGSNCSPGLTCDASAKSCRAASCPASCAAATVCDPSLKLCLSDCRLNGEDGAGCPSSSPTCASDGLCR